MPIEVGFWRLGEKVVRVDFAPMDSESRLEQILDEQIAILDPNLLLIGRQVPTDFGTFIDLLALDADGNLIVIELKRNRTPREVVAQLLDYGSWVTELEYADLQPIFEKYLEKYRHDQKSKSLDQAFRDKFGVKELPDPMLESHKLVLVSGELDESTERIINYLAEEYGVFINAVFFRFFKDGASEYLSRAWLIDPSEVEAKVEKKREKLGWNGEFYVSFGHDGARDWEDARRYGFISAGGGSWYSKTLHMLEKGARIWVNIPGGVGYVGVGKVIDEAIPVDEFMVDDGKGNRVPISIVSPKAEKMTAYKSNPENAEYLVRVKWIKTVPMSEAFREKGLFGNQNSAAKPRTSKWGHTVDRLKAKFGVAD